MSQHPLLSVLIPTYNRKESLICTLESLKKQNLLPELYEIVIIDDGSQDGTREIASVSFPFSLRYVFQGNNGAVQARNLGAQVTTARYLVLMDDDITLDPNCLSAFLTDLQSRQRAILVGSLQSVMPQPSQPFHNLFPLILPTQQTLSDDGEIPFIECLSGFMAIRRADYFAIGMMQGLNQRGANPWCDVEFAYRAHQQGYTIYRCQNAIGYHYDSMLRDFTTFCKRCESIGQLGEQLFQKHPGLREAIPTLRDKQPVSLLTDSPGVIIGKVLRRLLWSPPSVAVMKQFNWVLEKYKPNSILLALFYRWIISAYIYKGYRQGLHELAKAME